MNDEDTSHYVINKRIGFSKRQVLLHRAAATYGIDLEWVDLLVLEDRFLTEIAKIHEEVNLREIAAKS